ncbi:MAG: nitroreductase family deazaflavin-dependent oxidoreductase [Frankia sp.]
MATVDGRPRENSLEWVVEHTRRYRESEGDGHMWRDGIPTLVLVTRAAGIGSERRTSLIYGPHGDDHVVIASAGGADHHPVWYRNLLAQPDVQVRVGTERFHARARTAGDDERVALWSKMIAIWPDYECYQVRTDRPIPVVVLERI